MMRTNNYGYFIKACFLSLALSVSGAIHAADDDEIIEFQGDRYVIHVDRMNPDGEMTLMDVLNTCPEFLSIDSRHAHLFATVKANKQLGKKCNVFAEFHDMAGYVTGPWLQLTDLYQNRALSVGATIYPFR